MPRKKTEDENKIRLKKINQTIIERKDCLGVNLCFTDVNVFSVAEWDIISNYFKCPIVNGDTMFLRTRNSWKGFVMFFLSLAYMKYKGELEQVLGKLLQPKRSSQIVYTNVSRDYWFLVKDSIGKWETRSDPRIEQIPAPPDYSLCYVVGRYEPNDIEYSLCNFCNLFGVDKERSTVDTVYSEEIPHQYQMHSVENPYKGPGPFRTFTSEELSEYITTRFGGSHTKID